VTEWESFSPTWSRKGIPSGVTAVGDPVDVPNGSGGSVGFLWRGSDGNLYQTDYGTEWESFSPTWSRKGIPSGVTPVSDPVIVPNGKGGSAGFIWRGSDGNIYQTDYVTEWESFSPTWSRKGIPSGVTAVSEPVIVPNGKGGSAGFIWRGSDGNIYQTTYGTEWESFSPTWSRKGIPSGVNPAGELVIALHEGSSGGFVWRGSDGSIYQTDYVTEWESFSPTWSRKGIPSGVTMAVNTAP
jgi:hypothetical protein